MTASTLSAKAVAIAVAAALTPFAVELSGTDRADALATQTIHVSTSGDDSLNGSADYPVRTISRAVTLAGSSVPTRIEIESGTYHESVQVYGKDVDITAAAGATVTLDGARPVTGWTRRSTGWSAPWAAWFARTSGDMIDPQQPMAAYPDQAFLDGNQLTQVPSLDKLTAGTFYVDSASQRLYIGSDPSGRLVEASDLAYALYFNKADGSSLSGVTVRRYATPASDMAAVRAYSNRITVSDTVVESNAYMGLSAIGADITFAGITSRDNGYIGVHGHQAPRFTLRDSVVVRNNASCFDAWHSGSGVKVTTSKVVNFWSNVVTDNKGPGLWTDLSATFVSVVGNLVERNTYSGIVIELSGHAVIVDNTVLDSGQAGVWVLESNDVEVWHNALYRNDRDVWVEDGPRSDPSSDELANWDVNRVSIENNAMGQGRDGVQAVLAVDDWTQRRSARSMSVTSDHNAYWLPADSGTGTNLSRWARWPQGLAISATLESHQYATGQDLHSVVSTSGANPFARSMSGGDLRTGGLTGAPTTATVAAALGVPTGTRLPVGPRSALRGSGSVGGTGSGTGSEAVSHAVPRTRFFTTRVGGATFDGYFNTGGRLAAGSTTEIEIAGRGIVPRNATSVELRVTTRSRFDGRVTVSACGVAAPAAGSHRVRSRQRTVSIIEATPGTGGRICVFTSQRTRLAIDVIGYTTAA